MKNKNFIFIDLFNKNFNIYKKNVNDLYIYINHYNNTFEILRKNINSGATIEFDENLNFIKNVLNIKVKIDYESLKYFFDKKMKKLNYNTNSLYEYYDKILIELKISIRQDDNTNTELLSQKLAEIYDLLRIHKIIEKSENCFCQNAFSVYICNPADKKAGCYLKAQ